MVPRREWRMCQRWKRWWRSKETDDRAPLPQSPSLDLPVWGKGNAFRYKYGVYVCFRMWPVTFDQEWKISKNTKRPKKERALRHDQKKITKILYTYRIKFVLSLHVVLNKHNVVNRFFQLKWILLSGSNVTERVVQTRHDWWETIVASPKTTKSTDNATEPVENKTQKTNIYHNAVLELSSEWWLVFLHRNQAKSLQYVKVFFTIFFPYLFVAVVECSPLHPPGRWWRSESGLEALELVCSAAARASLNLFLFFMLLPAIFCAAKSLNRSFGTLISNSFGNFVMKNFRTHGAILCVLGFR